MAESFDPYRKWLGIPPEEQPPNHYRLLGIALYEDDTDVITYAADRQMSHVRKFQAGRHGQLSQQILNELAKARLCLLDRAQKIAYDQELRKNDRAPQRIGREPVAARKAPPLPSAPVPAPPQPEPPLAAVATIDPPTAPLAIPVSPAPSPVTAGARPVRSATSRVRKKASPVPLVLGICGLGAALALVAIAAVVSSGPVDEATEPVAAHPRLPTPSAASHTPASVDRPARPTRERPPHGKRPKPEERAPQQPDKLIIPDNPQNDVDDDAPSLPTITREPTDQEDPGDDSTIGGVPTADKPGDDEPEEGEAPIDNAPDDSPATEEPPAADPEILNDPQRAEKFLAAVTEAREALARRDLKEAARHLSAARRLQHGEAEASQAEALAELQLHLGAFWRLVTTGVRKLQPGDELEFAGDVATFDESSEGNVALFVTGERLSRPVEDVEPHYLMAIAQRGTPRPDAKSRLAMAAFLALDASASQSDRREEARRLLAEAVSLGGRSPALEQMLGDEEAP